MKRPPLNWLRAFETAARRGGFVSAAEELGVTASAVSQHVRALEARLGERLFERGASGVALTRAGQRYAESIGRAFELIDEATADLTKRGARQSLVVQAPTSFASQWIAPRLDLFRAEHPEIDLSLTALSGQVERAGSGVDAEIRYGWGDWPKLDAVELMRDEVFPVCAAKRAATLRRPEDLRDHDLLHVPGYAEDWDAWLAVAGVSGVNTAQGASFDQSIMAIRAAIEGKGVMLGRSSLIERELASGLLVAPFRRRLKSNGAYWFVATLRKSRAPKVDAFRRWLLAIASR